MTTRLMAAGRILGFMVLTCAGVSPGTASAQGNTCNGFVQIAYVAGNQPAIPGDTIRVRITLFTGTISGGTALTVNRVRFDLDCNDNFALGLPCTDDGSVISYERNITSTGCLDAGSTPVSFSDNSGVGNFNPNEVIFTPSSPVVMGANTPVNSGCIIEFDVTVQAYSNDTTPNDVQEVVGYRIITNDAECDNDLASAGSQSSAILLAAFTPTPTSTETATPTRTPTRTATNTLTSTPTSTATVLVCGNGILQPGETCEPPGSLQPPNNNPCRQDCTYCGDAIIQGSETCDDGNSNNNDACHNDCTRHLRNDPALIWLRSGTRIHDRLQVHGNFENDHLIDPTNIVVGMRLINADGSLVFSAAVPLGAMTVRHTKVRTFFRYDNPGNKTSPGGGVTLFKVAKDARWYRVNAWAWGDLSAANPSMTMEIFFGDERYTSAGVWRRTFKGWYMFLK